MHNTQPLPNIYTSVRSGPDVAKFRPKVAHITTVDVSLRYLLLNQLCSLREAGYDVVGISAPGPHVTTLEAAGIPHIPITMTRNVTPMADLMALWRLYRVMRREKFHIVHAHTPKAELLGQVAARLAGVPIVVDTFRGIYLRKEMHPLWRRLFIGMARLSTACADTVLSQSQEAQQVAVREGVCPPNKIKFLGNGIDVERFDPARLDQTILRQKRRELGLTPNAPIVGFVGRLVREKGILELLQAIRNVRQELPDVRLLIIGPSDEEKSDALTWQIAQQFGLADCCIFTGLRADMPELYGVMNLFVLPSHREGFPRSPLEASAMGVPCLVTDIPGCREAVVHNRNGLLVPLCDASALTKAIIDLLTHPEKAIRLGAEGRRMALKHFDERVIFEKVKAEYQQLLSAKKIPGPESQPLPTEVSNVSKNG